MRGADIFIQRANLARKRGVLYIRVIAKVCLTGKAESGENEASKAVRALSAKQLQQNATAYWPRPAKTATSNDPSGVHGATHSPA